VAPIVISLIEDCCSRGCYWTNGVRWSIWNHHFEDFTIAIMTWITVTEYLCHRWSRIWSLCRYHNSTPFSLSWLITGFITRVTYQCDYELVFTNRCWPTYSRSYSQNWKKNSFTKI